MASARTKTGEITYVLELSEREAAALSEALIAVHSFEGEGEILDHVYGVLAAAGAESDELTHEVVDGQVIVRRTT